MNRPALSVVIPCYNEEATLPLLHARVSAAARAAVGDDHEIVLVNDGSRDGSWAAMQALSAADRRVVATLIRFEEADAGAASRAVVAFDAVVTRGGRIERTGRWCATAPIADASGTTRARAFETALGAAVSAFVAERAGGC